MWYKVVESGRGGSACGRLELNFEEPVEIRPKSTTNSPNRPKVNRFCAVFASFVTLTLEELMHVSRQSSNPGRREGTPQDPGRVQAGDRREIWSAILHHKFRRQGCSSVSLRRMGTDRAETGRAADVQPYQEEVSQHDRILGTAGRSGWAGQVVAAAVAARCGAAQGRGRGCRFPEISGSAQPGGLPQRDRRRQVHF